MQRVCHGAPLACIGCAVVDAEGVSWIHRVCCGEWRGCATVNAEGVQWWMKRVCRGYRGCAVLVAEGVLCWLQLVCRGGCRGCAMVAAEGVSWITNFSKNLRILIKKRLVIC